MECEGEFLQEVSDNYDRILFIDKTCGDCKDFDEQKRFIDHLLNKEKP